MIIFDTETTSLSSYYGQIAQLSYVKVNENSKVEFAKNFYFAVNEVDSGASAVTGLTAEKLEELSGGKKFLDHAEEIYNDFIREDLIIAHNLDFDKDFLLEEFKRLGKKTNLFEYSTNFCTMQYYTDILKLPRYRGYKYPKLSEVVEYLGIDEGDLKLKTSQVFGVNEVGYHDARFDVVSVLAICEEVFELKNEIESALNDENTTIRKAVMLEKCEYPTIVFDRQFNSEELEYLNMSCSCNACNVDLIHLKENKYLALRYGYSNIHIISVSKHETEYPVNVTGENEYEVLDIFSYPNLVDFPEVSYKVEEYKEMLELPHFYHYGKKVYREQMEIKDFNSLEDINIEEDDEIPF